MHIPDRTLFPTVLLVSPLIYGEGLATETLPTTKIWLWGRSTPAWACRIRTGIFLGFFLFSFFFSGWWRLFAVVSCCLERDCTSSLDLNPAWQHSPKNQSGQTDIKLLSMLRRAGIFLGVFCAVSVPENGLSAKAPPSIQTCDRYSPFPAAALCFVGFYLLVEHCRGAGQHPWPSVSDSIVFASEPAVLCIVSVLKQFSCWKPK